MFPKSAYGDADIPAASPAQEGLLPHLHGDWEDRFPRAEACAELDDKDPDSEEGMEARGEAIGIELGTFCGEKKVD